MAVAGGGDPSPAVDLVFREASTDQG